MRPSDFLRTRRPHCKHIHLLRIIEIVLALLLELSVKTISRTKVWYSTRNTWVYELESIGIGCRLVDRLTDAGTSKNHYIMRLFDQVYSVVYSIVRRDFLPCLKSVDVHTGVMAMIKRKLVQDLLSGHGDL